MKDPLAIGILVGRTIEVKYVFPACVVEIESKVYPADLIELDVLDFDVVLGMDWLSENYASIDCHDKCIRFKMKESIDFVFQGERSKVLIKLISVIRARRSLDKGCQGFLAYVINGEAEPIDVQSILIAREYLDVFSRKLPGLPLEREVEFTIELT